MGLRCLILAHHSSSGDNPPRRTTPTASPDVWDLKSLPPGSVYAPFGSIPRRILSQALGSSNDWFVRRAVNKVHIVHFAIAATFFTTEDTEDTQRTQSEGSITSNAAVGASRQDDRRARLKIQAGVAAKRPYRRLLGWVCQIGEYRGHTEGRADSCRQPRARRISQDSSVFSVFPSFLSGENLRSPRLWACFNGFTTAIARVLRSVSPPKPQ